MLNLSVCVIVLSFVVRLSQGLKALTQLDTFKFKLARFQLAMIMLIVARATGYVTGYAFVPIVYITLETLGCIIDIAAQHVTEISNNTIKNRMVTFLRQHPEIKLTLIEQETNNKYEVDSESVQHLKEGVRPPNEADSLIEQVKYAVVMSMESWFCFILLLWLFAPDYVGYSFVGMLNADEIINFTWSKVLSIVATSLACGLVLADFITIYKTKGTTDRTGNQWENLRAKGGNNGDSTNQNSDPLQ